MQIIGAALAFYLLLTAAVFLMQRTLLYPGARDTPDLALYAGLGIGEVTTKTADGLMFTHWYRPPDSNEGPVVVVFQGNAGHLGDRVPKLKPLTQALVGYGTDRCPGNRPHGNSHDASHRDSRADS